MSASVVAHLRIAITVALERLEAGDTEGATSLLLAAVEDGPVEGEQACPLCGWRGFPGALEHHLLYGHGVDREQLVSRAAIGADEPDLTDPDEPDLRDDEPDLEAS